MPKYIVIPNPPNPIIHRDMESVKWFIDEAVERPSEEYCVYEITKQFWVGKNGELEQVKL